MRKYVPFLICLLGGVGYAAGYPGVLFPQLFLLPIIGFSCLEFFLRSESRLKQKFLLTLCFAIGLTFAGYYWIPYTMFEFGGIIPPFNYLLGAAFSLIVLPQYFIYVLVDNYREDKLADYWKELFSQPAFKALLLALLETYVPQQFPAHLGHPWMQMAPFIGLAPFIGAVGYSYFSYLIAFSVVDIIKQKRMPIIPIIASIVFILCNAFMPLQRPNENLETIKVRLVQANIGSLMKLQSESGLFGSVRTVLKTYSELTKQPAEKKIDLVIWPETAYPNQTKSEILKSNYAFMPRVFLEASRDMEADFFTGGYDSVKNSGDNYYESEYNAAFFINKEGLLSDVYHKMKLIPFGEGLPFGPLNRFFSKIITNITYFAQGDKYTLFKTSDGHYFSTAICYEILFSNFIRKYLNSTSKDPSFLINITNDSWYGPTSEPHQHLFLSKWRAVENNIPVIRMTNTGISSILYEDGSESKRTGVFTKEILDLDLTFQKKRVKTLYQTVGFGVVFIIAIIILVLTLLEKSLLLQAREVE
jgi:apolipoprotein N-acyltransferase